MLRRREKTVRKKSAHDFLQPHWLFCLSKENIDIARAGVLDAAIIQEVRRPSSHNDIFNILPA